MSWFDGKLLTEAEVRKTSVKLPARFQIGDDVLVWLEGDGGVSTSVQAVVIGITFSAEHSVRYDLAIPAGNKLFSVAKGVNGVITDLEGNEPDWDDRSILPQDVLSRRISELIHNSKNVCFLKKQTA